MSRVEADDTRQQRERRVIHHRALLGIGEVLVVTSRHEGANHLHTIERIDALHKLKHGIIHRGRRIAVVGRLLRLELIYKRVVIVEHLRLRALQLFQSHGLTE